MATLANVSGGSFVSDFGQTLGAGFEAQNVRRRAEEDQADLESKLKDALGLGGPSSQVVDDAALGRLGQLSPQMAQAVGQASQNPEAATQLREQAQRGLTLSEELQNLPDHAARLKRIAAEGGTQAAEGGDLTRLVALSNMDESQLNLELQRMQLIGKDTLSSLPPPPTATSAFAALIADNPQVGTALLGRRDQQIAQERQRRAAEAQARAAAAARARAAAGPQGEFAKGLAQIEGNFAGGHITEADRDARIANLRTEHATVAEPTFDPQSPEGKLVADLVNIGKTFGTDSDQYIGLAASMAADVAADAENLLQTQLENDALVAESQAPPPDATAPKTITQTRADGSDITLQWTPNVAQPQGGAWTPLATEGVAEGTVIQSTADLTEGESKLTLFKSQMDETSPVLSDIETQFNPANIPDATARNTPIVGNFFTSSEGQVYNAAASAWAEGALRIATGAAATPEEIVRTRETYFAKPGDTPTTTQFKSDLRDMYSRSIDRALGSTDVEGSLQTPEEFARDLQNVISTDIPESALSNPTMIATANRVGVTVEEIWGKLSDEAKAQLSGGQ